MLPLWDTEKHRRAPVVTLLLIAVNAGVFLYQLALSLRSRGALAGFMDAHALVPAALVDGVAERGPWLTVVTSMFLHGGFAHVAGNCWFLWIFGGNVEDRLGRFRFLVFYLLAGVAGALAQVAVHPGSTIPMVGASGAISGVLGAYFILLPMAWIVTLVPWVVPVLPIPAFVFLFVWFAFQAMSGVGSLLSGSAAGGGVAWWAHAGGFAAGVVMILFARKRGWARKR